MEAATRAGYYPVRKKTDIDHFDGENFGLGAASLRPAGAAVAARPIWAMSNSIELAAPRWKHDAASSFSSSFSRCKRTGRWWYV